MSRKDYIALSSILKEHLSLFDYVTVESIAEDIARVLASDNPRFDRQKFLRACGLST